MTKTEPTDVRAMLRQAMDHHEADRLAEAEPLYLEVAALGYRRAEIMGLLAGIAEADDRSDAALSRWREVLKADPLNLRASVAIGGILHRMGRRTEAAEVLEAASAIAPDDPQILANLSVALFDAGRHDEALAAFRRADARWPNNPLLQHQMRRAVAAVVPFWHIPMMNDRPRNDAFERAIIGAIAAHGVGARVLDIGTGSGLLSMMAARAGAGSVVACEAVPAIADAARTVIRANGYDDRIRVVPKMSTDLVVGTDLNGPADVLISEILSSDLLTENVLATFEDALARLMKPSATIIPNAVTAVGCLAGGEALEHRTFVRTTAGFDLSAFSSLAPQRLPITGASPSWTRLSDNCDLLHIDLTARTNPPTLAKLSVPVSASGVAVGVVQWMRIHLGEGITFTNPPDLYREGGQEGGWMQILHTFPRPITVQAGETVELAVGHDRTSLILAPITGSA